MRRLIIFVLILAVTVSAASAGDKIKFPQFSLSLGVVGWSAADTALTIYGTSHLGLVEKNRLMRPLLEGHHYAALWAIQAAGVAGILWACHGLIHSDDKFPRVVGYVLLVAANVGRAYCVFSNLRLHRRLMKGD